MNTFTSAHHVILNSAPNTFCLEIAQKVLLDAKFVTYPSSIDKHHNWRGGNLKHTSEVIEFAMEMAMITTRDRKVDESCVYLSSLLHDYGKIYAYEPYGTTPDCWRKVKNYTPSLHIEKSIERAKELIDGRFLGQVLHCIGAHHRTIEWGSLWEPETREAWIVHLADMASVFCIENRPQ